jgi:hypothetical protein
MRIFKLHSSNFFKFFVERQLFGRGEFFRLSEVVATFITKIGTWWKFVLALRACDLDFFTTIKAKF